MNNHNKLTTHANCPHCGASGQHAVSVTKKGKRTIASVVCKACGFALGGDVERMGPDTTENLLQDIGRALRNGDLKQVVKRDTKTDVPPVEDWEQNKP